MQAWSGPEVLRVPANGKAEYAITYRPVTMSSTAAPHEGSVFFPIPDGSGLLYRLSGIVSDRTGASNNLCLLVLPCMLSVIYVGA